MRFFMFERLGFVLHTIILLSCFAMSWNSAEAAAEAFRYHFHKRGGTLGSERSVVGCLWVHTVAPKETLLDIARKYALGFNEMRDLYPQLDPWIPEPGLRLSIPTQWIVPPNRRADVVVNLAELRLYRYFSKQGRVKTYPVGIGSNMTETPSGSCKVTEKIRHPTWHIPPSLREKYRRATIPPGPRNPLGDYWMALSLPGYGIHGTNFPWAVGRAVSHGCIRLYPEHIGELYDEMFVGAHVSIIYEPVKVGFLRREIFMEVHPDVYGRIPDLNRYGQERLAKSGAGKYASAEKVESALREQKGVPVWIGTVGEGGGMSITRR
ncbi:MAG: L,D-transpeptidase family protein [Deltaproteobacteria bacterium]|nr:L,D-transpeptidase family protein [Deltaproteobacteria bacterium]